MFSRRSDKIGKCKLITPTSVHSTSIELRERDHHSSSNHQGNHTNNEIIHSCPDIKKEYFYEHSSTYIESNGSEFFSVFIDSVEEIDRSNNRQVNRDDENII